MIKILLGLVKLVRNGGKTLLSCHRAAAATMIIMDKLTGKLSKHSLKWFMGMRIEEICGGMEEK
ncbi:MAG: hypothetical protein Q7U60_05755 [Candidatus Methanoperedens sp.]|nr:hypothetical protein [Candidatus Methanoperedens sp.]